MSTTRYVSALDLMAVVDCFNGFNAVASGLRIPYEPPIYANQD